jgi:putative transposase
VGDEDTVDRPADLWATFCLAVVGPLLTNPPEPGDLQSRIEEMAARTYAHPITREPVSFGTSTIERWFYRVRKNQSKAVDTLRRRVRKDAGTQWSLSERVRTLIQRQYKDHRRWSYQLHWDNLRARAKADPTLGAIPSYPTVRRYMRAVGLYRKKRHRRPDTPGTRLAEARLESVETRGYEVPTVNGLWHLDFHEGSRPVLLPDGSFVPAYLLGILDDRSRLACHLQWYLEETIQALSHGVSQGFEKRGLCWELMSDRGKEMNGEYIAGLRRLGVEPVKTLPVSPHQNGKQEAFWGQVEGRLMAMLENHKNLTLEFLNEATQAWVEYEYNRKVHDELGVSPLQRFLEGPYVGRESPSGQELRRMFRIERRRTQRRSDGTISLEGRRFEIPSRFRHVRRVHVRYARWDLTAVDMVDERTGVVLAPLYPQDKAQNSDGQRKSMEPLPDAELITTQEPPSEGIAPLLRQLMEEAAATGLPPAYLPYHPVNRDEDGYEKNGAGRDEEDNA